MGCVVLPVNGVFGAGELPYRNLMLTMFFGGLWHGASWKFVFWGFYHDVLLCAYCVFRRLRDALPRLLQQTGMFGLTLVG